MCLLVTWCGPGCGHGYAVEPGGGRGTSFEQKVLLLLELRGKFGVHGEFLKDKEVVNIEL